MRNVVLPTASARGRRFDLGTIAVLMVALAVGVLSTVGVIGSIRAYHATHRQVVATVVQESAIVARVTWTDDAGVRRDGRVRAPLDRVSDTQARIWLDRQGRPAPRPFGPVEIVLCFLLAAASAAGLTSLAWWRVRRLGHWWTARRAVRGLDARWRDQPAGHSRAGPHDA